MSGTQKLNMGLVLGGALAICLACLLGDTSLTPDRVLAGLFGTGDPVDQVIVREIRLPRALSAWTAGAALGVSGAALQGLLRNPLAEPGVLGVTATASLGASFSIHYGLAAIMAVAVPVSAILGALAATGLIALAAMRVRSAAALILVGVGISSFAAAAMALLMNLAPHPFTLSDMINWMLGSVANRSFDDLALSAPFILAGVAVLVWSRRGLSLLTLGDEAAAGAGLDLGRQRLLVTTGAGLATGGAVALAGAVGFVGIVAPHMVRPLAAHDPARTLLPAGLLAGLIVVLADIGVRILPTSNELKLGVVAAIIGAPVFVMIAMQRRASDV